eukprot:3569480-Amphidinium_carterae.1
MLSLIDPSNYPMDTKPLRRMSEEAAVCRNKWYTTFVSEVNKQKTFTQVASDDDAVADDMRVEAIEPSGDVPDASPYMLSDRRCEGNRSQGGNT